MFKNKKYDQILDILQELLARTQENKNGIARIERKVEEMRKPKSKAKSHIKKAEEIKVENQKRKPGRPKKVVDKVKNEKVEQAIQNRKKRYYEGEIKNPGQDLSVNDFAKILGVAPETIRSRIQSLRKTTTWANNDNFIYLVRASATNGLKENDSIGGRNKVLMLTLPAQQQMIRRYGKGKNPSGRKPKNNIA